jgi:ribosomal protein L31
LILLGKYLYYTPFGVHLSFLNVIMKKWIYAQYYKDVEVNCICGASFKVNTTVEGPIKVETCRYCHPAFNENKEVKKVIKGRMEKFLEKQEAIKAAQAKKSA